MKGQRSAQAKSARKLSHSGIARRYLDLQLLRDKVREAEITCTIQGSKSRTRFNARARSAGRRPSFPSLAVH